MVGVVKKFLIGASVAAGMSAIATTPAFAGTLTGATIGGTAADDYYVYDSNTTDTFLVPSNAANVQKVLSGNAASPTGNVELRRSSEQANFDFTKNTTLTGQIGGKDITLSSLTASDWTGAFANKWYSAALVENGFASVLNNAAVYVSGFNKFKNNGGFQRFSDPNISYVNQDDSTGQISIGLAGHFDATDLLLAGLTQQEKGMFFSMRSADKQGKAIQASEIVKYTYDGKTDYLYSFLATNSGLVNGVGPGADGKSHNGNYEVKMPGSKAVSAPGLQAVPEPSSVLALIALGGIFASKRKLMKQA